MVASPQAALGAAEGLVQLVADRLAVEAYYRLVAGLLCPVDLAWDIPTAAFCLRFCLE